MATISKSCADIDGVNTTFTNGCSICESLTKSLFTINLTTRIARGCCTVGNGREMMAAIPQLLVATTTFVRSLFVVAQK
ncbi:MAG: hypothetical protein Q8P67_18890 [archaeon]|nr:hypothetical protein [archaeon]